MTNSLVFFVATKSLASSFLNSVVAAPISSLWPHLDQLGWAIASIFLVEMVRDLYHVLSHQLPPLQRLHNWHHRAYKKDFSPISTEVYRQAQLYNDAPESIFMMVVMGLAAVLTDTFGLWLGVLYAAGFLIAAVLRSRGLLTATDLTHEPGPLTTLPGHWKVNRSYHWRHHFDNTHAYYAGLFPLSDQILGTALSLKGKTVAVTGASGTLGRALIVELAKQGAKPIALSTSCGNSSNRPESNRPESNRPESNRPESNRPESNAPDIPGATTVIPWCVGQEADLRETFAKVDILLINHGINVMGEKSPHAIEQSLEINALSGWRMMEVFLETVDNRTGHATKEVWINTSEAEVNPAFSPLYEISKRLMGDLINLRRSDAPCIIRKLVLGPFKSKLNPVGVMSARAVARGILFLAKRDIRNIIVTINPLTYVLFPIKELTQAIYFRLFLKSAQSGKVVAAIATQNEYPS